MLRAYLGLEAAQHAYDKRIVGETHYVALSKYLFDLITQHKVVLVNFLHRKTLMRLFVTNQVNSTIQGTPASAKHVKIDYEVLTRKRHSK